LIVCHCNALRESQVRQVARECDGSIDDAYARLGCEVECGGCVPYARLLIDEESRELLAA